MRYLNLDQNSQHSELQKLAKNPPKLQNVLDKEREARYKIQHEDVCYEYDKALVNETVIDHFQSWVDEQLIVRQYHALLNGDLLNCSENKAVTHHETRRNFNELLSQIQSTQKRFVSQGIRTIVVVGIGGSELGPRAIYESLIDTYHAQFDVAYISNIDPIKTESILRKLDPETTAFLITSKSGATLETILNWDLIMAWNEKNGREKSDLNKKTVAITTLGSPLENAGFSEVFIFEESIVGRFGTTSACGMTLIGLVFGTAVVQEFLEGAAEMDRCALNPSCRDNASLMSASIGVWNRTYLGMPNLAIIAYASSLRFFVKQLQQIDCESNGKSVNRYKEFISYPTAPMVVSGYGTNAQHTFFQALHQGSDIMPIEFIGIQSIALKGESKLQDQMKRMHHHLNTNLRAQSLVLAEGKLDTDDPNKYFPGNRPSTTTWLATQSPRNLGALLAFYENKVMFQGFLWNLNSFDQEGVQLGKNLAKELI